MDYRVDSSAEQASKRVFESFSSTDYFIMSCGMNKREDLALWWRRHEDHVVSPNYYRPKLLRRLSVSDVLSVFEY
jgi:hypothetical protein